MSKKTQQMKQPYDIARILDRYEADLIRDLMRQLRRGVDPDAPDWTRWQADQLLALQGIKRKYAKRLPGLIQQTQSGIRDILRESYRGGLRDCELDILRAVEKGYKVRGRNLSAIGDRGVRAAFNRTDERRLEALIDAVSHDTSQACTAILRHADDQYRKIVYDAVVYAAQGQAYAKAADMAARDLLRHGIACVTYRSGSRHRASDYAEMAVRTAGKRSYLAGQGAMRRDWGIHTVIINRRVNACTRCMPFQGRVFIDDVWSGGTAQEAAETGYPLLSDAIAHGLYHPNCRDAHTTYFAGITQARPLTRAEADQALALEKQEQAQQEAARNAESYGRLAEYALDEENKQKYKARRDEWRAKTREASNENQSD